MDIEKTGKDILDAAFAIHSRFGSGLLGKGLLDKSLGFVINFGMPSLKDGIERIVNKL
jgi:hypothetical protein